MPAAIPEPEYSPGEEPDGHAALSWTDDGNRRRFRLPFVWQSGSHLLLLDEEESVWVFAELLFDVKACRYAEVRRSVFAWPREAIGALVSRALVAGPEAAEEAAQALEAWLAQAPEWAYQPEPAATPAAFTPLN